MSAAGSGSGSAIPKLPSSAARKKEAWGIFCDACRIILTKWDLLDTAVSEEWGGRRSKSKFDHIVDDLLMNTEEQWREGNDLHLDTLDVYLIECLESDFNITFEDDDVVTSVSMLIQEAYRRCAEDDIDGVRKLILDLEKHPAMQKAARTHEDEEDGEEGSGSGEEDEEEEIASAAHASHEPKGPKRVVDEDGWETIVKPGRKGGKPGSAAPVAPSVAEGGHTDGATEATAAVEKLNLSEDATKEKDPPAR